MKGQKETTASGSEVLCAIQMASYKGAPIPEFVHKVICQTLAWESVVLSSWDVCAERVSISSNVAEQSDAPYGLAVMDARRKSVCQAEVMCDLLYKVFNEKQPIFSHVPSVSRGLLLTWV